MLLVMMWRTRVDRGKYLDSIVSNALVGIDSGLESGHFVVSPFCKEWILDLNSHAMAEIFGVDNWLFWRFECPKDIRCDAESRDGISVARGWCFSWTDQFAQKKSNSGISVWASLEIILVFSYFCRKMTTCKDVNLVEFRHCSEYLWNESGKLKGEVLEATSFLKGKTQLANDTRRQVQMSNTIFGMTMSPFVLFQHHPAVIDRFLFPILWPLPSAMIILCLSCKLLYNSVKPIA